MVFDGDDDGDDDVLVSGDDGKPAFLRTSNPSSILWCPVHILYRNKNSLRHMNTVQEFRNSKTKYRRKTIAVQSHFSLLSNQDCHEFRLSIVRIVISVSNVTSHYDCLHAIMVKNLKTIKNCQSCQNKLTKLGDAIAKQ